MDIDEKMTVVFGGKETRKVKVESAELSSEVQALKENVLLGFV